MFCHKKLAIILYTMESRCWMKAGEAGYMNKPCNKVLSGRSVNKLFLSVYIR